MSEEPVRGEQERKDCHDEETSREKAKTSQPHNAEHGVP
jgi:hypothetical protein